MGGSRRKFHRSVYQGQPRVSAGHTQLKLSRLGLRPIALELVVGYGKVALEPYGLLRACSRQTGKRIMHRHAQRLKMPKVAGQYVSPWRWACRR